MKDAKKIKSKAGAFAVAILFLAMTAATTITSAVILQQPQQVQMIQQQAQAVTPTPEMQEEEAQSEPSIPGGTIYCDEEIQYPPTLPPGTSSLTFIRARRGLNPWESPIWYDVGFTPIVMRLRNGPVHTWHFYGYVLITYTDGRPDYNMLIDEPMVWSGQTELQFDIVSAGYYSLGYFNTAHLTATIYKDLGPNEPKDRWFYGAEHYGIGEPALGGL